MLFDPASFRDPAGRVIHRDGRILRAVAASHEAVVRDFLASDFYGAHRGSSIITTEIINDQLSELRSAEGIDAQFVLLLEHEKLDCITYPYEWPFSLLKKAAKLHLELHLEALASGFDLSDASAYNVQFSGTRPIFIDLLSFTRYEEGSYWVGYQQFCKQFLCPLLLAATHGITYNQWYRGAVNGLDVTDIAKLMPLRARLSPRVLMHVLWHAKLLRRFDAAQTGVSVSGLSTKGLSLVRLKGLISSVLKWVNNIEPKGLSGTYWKNYELRNSYSDIETEAKRRVVADFVSAGRACTVLDIGCNSGDLSEVCLSAGAQNVIGVDFDQGALQAAISRAEEKRLNLLPLFLDLTNPSPAQGWANSERSSFAERIKPDALIALAVIHHLVISKNIPLESVIDWLVSTAPRGIVEFVPKSDPMVQQMLWHRADIFPDYTEERFLQLLRNKVRVVSRSVVSSSGRAIVQYERA